MTEFEIARLILTDALCDTRRSLYMGFLVDVMDGTILYIDLRSTNYYL